MPDTPKRPTSAHSNAPDPSVPDSSTHASSASDHKPEQTGTHTSQRNTQKGTHSSRGRVKKPRPSRNSQRTRRPHHEQARTFRPFSSEELAARAAAIPVISYPDLPVSARREEIAEAIRTHQVTIVSGETGSGKTTQLPKICLQLGRGVSGIIGHTQPRRIAARSVADRIAEELGQKVGREAGQVVGYQVRFTDEVGPTTLVKLMTDGILLSEIQADPLLRRYDTLIIDEAHERSLNIDFILGYLARLLPARPDLKVIITSATIDSARFAAHFGRWDGLPGRGTLLEAAPVIEVSGRTYPVEIRYRPLAPDIASSYSTTTQNTDSRTSGPALGHQDSSLTSAYDSTQAETLDAHQREGAEQLVLEDPGEDLPSLGYGLGEQIDVESAICSAVDELCAEGEGDILVFLPGERDIRETEHALLDHLGPRGVRAGETKGARPGDIEILPLFARLSAAEQHRIFEEHHLRRIVLATNVAETSLTVPKIRYVIDPGLARISRYSKRTKVQRLPIEAISQASANQRAGRCGRVAEGIAIRLYSQRDYDTRPRYTEPEILRTSLASVILQMAALGLGSVADFPFLDPPEHRAIRDGIATLVEIGALAVEGNGRTQEHRLTRIGRELARLPIDPRLGRILLEGDKNGCASEILIIVAALSIQDVRERPLDHQQAADAAHARFADPRSDFVTYLHLWRYLEVQSRDLSGSQFRRMCRDEFLHYLRYREWRDVVFQLRQMSRLLGVEVHPLELPSSGEVADVARLGGVKDAAARAVVAFTESSLRVHVDEIHRSILVGFLSNLGFWDEVKREYRGARGTRFTIWPGSGLARSHPAWVMAAELVETSRLFARTLARIDPAWIEPLAGSLLTRVYSEPFWSSARGAAMVKEKLVLYGLTISADRPVLLGSLGDRVCDGGSRRASRLVTAGSLAGIAQGLLGAGEDVRSARQLGSFGRDFLAMALDSPVVSGSGEVGVAEGGALSSDCCARSGSFSDSESVCGSGSECRCGSRVEVGVGAGSQKNCEKHRESREKGELSVTSEASAKSGASVTSGAGGKGGPKQGEHFSPDARQDGDLAVPPSGLTAQELAREMFIRHALVDGQWRERHRFQKRNAELLEQAKEVERRSRTHGLVADEEARFCFFDDILPAHIVSAAHFNRWWKREREKRPDLLTYSDQLLLPRGIGEDAMRFPDSWRCGDVDLGLSYAFTPGSERDGVTLTIPVEVLARVSDEGCDWLVPGMREELITEMIRALPKAKRRLLAPAPEVARQVNEWMDQALAGTLTSFESPSFTSQSAPSPSSGHNGRSAQEECADPMSLSAALDRLARWGQATGKTRRHSTGSSSAQASSPARTSSSSSVPCDSGTSSTSSVSHSVGVSQTAGTPWGAGSPRGTASSQGAGLNAPSCASATASSNWSAQKPPFAQAFAQAITAVRGVDLNDSELAHAHAELPAHLRMTFRVVDSFGKELGAGSDLTFLQHSLAQFADEAVRQAVRGALAEAMSDATLTQGRGRNQRQGRGRDSAKKKEGEGPQKARNSRTTQAVPIPEGLHLDGLTDFPLTALPRSVESSTDSMTLRAFPALVPQGTASEPRAGVRVMANVQEAQRHHRQGLAHLLLMRVRLQRARVTTRWTGRQALMLAASPYPSISALVDDAQLASAFALVDELSGEGGPGSIRDVELFEALARQARDLHEDRVYEILGHVVRAMEAHSELTDRLRSHTGKSMQEVVEDVRRSVELVLTPGFVSATPAYALPHVARYVRAAALRIDRASSSSDALERDLADMDRIHALLERIAQARAECERRPYDAHVDAELSRARWLVEELRVSCFAQTLGTPHKVSSKRVASLIDSATASLH